MALPHRRQFGWSNPTHEICHGRFRSHSKERFARRAEVHVVQGFFAFRPMRLTARFDRRPALRLAFIAPAVHSPACENPHEYAIFARP